MNRYDHHMVNVALAAAAGRIEKLAADLSKPPPIPKATAAPPPAPSAPAPKVPAPAAPPVPTPIPTPPAAKPAAPSNDPLEKLRAMKINVPSSGGFEPAAKKPGMSGIMSRTAPAETASRGPKMETVGREEIAGPGKIPILKGGVLGEEKPAGIPIKWSPGQTLPKEVTGVGAGKTVKFDLSAQKGESQEAYNKRLKSFNDAVKKYQSQRTQVFEFEP